MPQTKEQKKQILEELGEQIANQKAMVFIDFTGIKVKDLSNFRKKVKKEGSSLKAAKKTLLKMALQGAGIELDVKGLQGEVATIFGLQDEVSPAKLAFQFSKENEKMKILGGYFEKSIRTSEDMIALAQIPSRDELLAKMVGSIQSPISGFVGVLGGNLRSLVQALNQISKTKV